MASQEELYYSVNTIYVVAKELGIEVDGVDPDSLFTSIVQRDKDVAEKLVVLVDAYSNWLKYTLNVTTNVIYPDSAHHARLVDARDNAKEKLREALAKNQ